MRLTITSILSLLLFFSCGIKKMTLEDLPRAKWEPLTNGIDHISTKSTKDTSIPPGFVMIGYQKGDKIVPISVSDLSTDMLREVTRKYLGNSATGYLRFDLLKMIGIFSPVIYFNNAYDSSSLSKDSAALVSIPGVISASFVSKEQARKQFEEMGENADWSEILTENPFPASIRIRLADQKWGSEAVDKLESAIQQKLAVEIDFQYSEHLLNANNRIYYFEYTRKK